MADPVVVAAVADWPGLADWLVDHPLPEGEDLDLNMTELATVFAISTNTVKSWLTQPESPMPCVEPGGNGREYVLRLSWCYAWRKVQEAKKKSRSLQLTQMQGTLFGVEMDHNDRELTSKQIREVAEARMAHANAAKMLGTLTEIDAVYQIIEEIFVVVRDTAMGACDRLERELSLTSPQTRQAEKVMEEMLTSMGNKLQESVIGHDYTPHLDMTRQLVNKT